METHAQHLHKAPGKNFWHYFFEFFMLFLAVSAGFMAENIREHHLETEREEQYMTSLIKDLKTDVVNLDSAITRNLINRASYDSLFYLLTLPDYSDQTGSIYFIGRRASLRDFFYMTDGTLKQLNNSGGLRLIHYPEIVDSINSYQNLYEDLVKSQQLKEIQLSDYRAVCCKVFDVRIFEEIMHGTKTQRPVGNPKLLSDKREDINELLMRAHYVKRNNAGTIKILEVLKQKSNNLQTLVKERYHLK